MSYVRPCLGTLLVALSLLGCDDDEAVSEPNPTQARKPANVCPDPPRVAQDEAAKVLNLGHIAGYCLDPHQQSRIYEQQSENPVSRICPQLPEAACRFSTSHRLRRVLVDRYIKADGSSAAVDVRVLSFGDQPAAYEYFSERLLRGQDPAKRRLERLRAVGAATVAAATALVWRGRHVAELTYTNQDVPPSRLEKRGHAVLSQIAIGLSRRLPGDVSLPPSVQRLPTDNRLPFGVEFTVSDVLGIEGAGHGAQGYYRDGSKRYRILIADHGYEPAAKDVESTMRRHSGYRNLEDMPYDAFELVLPNADGLDPTWLLARKHKLLVGVGDEPFVLTGGMSKEEKSRVSLERSQKLQILKAVLRQPRAVETKSAP